MKYIITNNLEEKNMSKNEQKSKINTISQPDGIGENSLINNIKENNDVHESEDPFSYWCFMTGKFIYPDTSDNLCLQDDD